MEKFIQLDKNNIDTEHICCAIADKNCKASYEAKKDWLRKEFENGYVFRRIDARAKVFIEYGPAEKGWAPVDAPNYLLINCFWVSGRYKGQGYAKALLQQALDDAKAAGKAGLVTVAGVNKLPFLSDTQWLIKQGFEVCDKTATGFCLLVRKINPDVGNPQFKETALSGTIAEQNGLVAYYSNRCPFAEFHVQTSLTATARNRKLPLTIIKLETAEQAQSAPGPATIFSLFYNGKFITTDISVCTDSRFDKIMQKVLAV